MQLLRGECPGPTERSVCVGRLLVVGRVVHSLVEFGLSRDAKLVFALFLLIVCGEE